jgi:hypothetical protein
MQDDSCDTSVASKVVNVDAASVLDETRSLSSMLEDDGAGGGRGSVPPSVDGDRMSDTKVSSPATETDHHILTELK